MMQVLLIDKKRIIEFPEEYRSEEAQRLLARRLPTGALVEVEGRVYERIDARRYHQRWGVPVRNQLPLFGDKTCGVRRA